MWLWDIGRWMTGTVTFRAQGGLCERFINLLLEGEDGVRLWQIVHEEDAVTATMRAADYNRVRAYARRTGTRVRLTARCGLPFCARPLTKRPGLFVGVVLAMCLYTVLASRIWVIQLDGVPTAQQAAVRACLAKNGVELGKPMNGVDLSALSLDAIAQIENLHRLSLYFDGSIAHVDVQWTKEGAVVPDTAPANILAASDGVILSMTVTSGQAMVKAGSAVVKGDLLVCGAVETTAGVLLRHAAATVIAETTHTFAERVALTETHLQDSTRTEQTALRVLWWEVPLWSPATFEGAYTVATYEKPLTFLGVTLPVGLVGTVYTAKEPVTVTYTPAEAERLARERLDATVAAALAHATVTEVVYEGVWDGDTYCLQAVCRCEEDIAQTVELLVR